MPLFLLSPSYRYFSVQLVQLLLPKAVQNLLKVTQAPAHTSSKICWPENIIPLFQPASAPELNPIERLWQFLKKPLKNKLFSSLQALRERIQEIFDQLTFEEVISVSSYNFILEALFYAASH